MIDNTLTGGTYGNLYAYNPTSEIDDLREENERLKKLIEQLNEQIYLDEKRILEYTEMMQNLTDKCLKYKETLKAVVDLMNE